MHRFHFHFRQGRSYSVDEEGCTFASAEDAYLGAFMAAQEMWHELLVQREDPRDCSFDVTDDRARLLFTLPFSEVLDVCTSEGSPPAPGARRDADQAIQRSEKPHHANRSDSPLKPPLQTIQDVRAGIEETRRTMRETRALLLELARVTKD